MADQKIAESLARELSESGVSTFMDFRDMKAGENWEEQIKNEIQSASYFVVLLSDNFIGSHWGMQELGAAIAKGIKIIPILLSDTKIPFDITKYQYLDMRGNNIEKAMKQFLVTVSSINE